MKSGKKNQVLVGLCLGYLRLGGAMRVCSSVVEHSAFNRLAVGSNPSIPNPGPLGIGGRKRSAR